MKKLFLFVFLLVFCFNSNSVMAQAIQVDCSNQTVGIAGAPSASYKLKVNGALYSSGDIVSTGNITGIDWLDNGSVYGRLNLGTSTILNISATSPYNNTALSLGGYSGANAITVNGTAWINDGGDVVASSDQKLKKDIKTLDGSNILEKIKSFEGKKYKLISRNELLSLQESGIVSYPIDTTNIYQEAERLFQKLSQTDPNHFEAILNMNIDIRKAEILNLFGSKVLKIFNFDKVINDSIGIKIRLPEYNDKKEQFGFIAQEVLDVFPELVKMDSITNIYGINYDGFIPILFEAIKAQQQQIETLQALVSAQENDIVALKGVGLKSATIDEETIGESMLYQNTPNPFNQSTEIKYYLAASVTDALISVCNLNGTQLKSIKINQTGEGNITIERETLHPGIYLYALVANGQLVDTKKMMITE